MSGLKARNLGADMSETESGKGPEQGFVDWIVSSPRGLEGLVVSMLYVTVVAVKNVPNFEHRFSLGPHNQLFSDSVPSMIQCLALLPALWQCFRISPPETLGSVHEVAVRACGQFAKCLTGLIAVWIAFYFLIFLSQITKIPGIVPWIDLLNNLQAVFLFACYWTLTAITIRGPDEPKVTESMSLPLILNYSLWFVLVFHLADLSLSKRDDPSYGSNRFWIQFLSGLAVGACMALLVGCLESEFLSARWTRLSTACLYCYAVLQLAYLGYNSSTVSAPLVPPTAPAPPAIGHLMQEFATITSLPLKLLFVGFCYWALQSGRLAFYMEKTRNLIKNVPREWEEFLPDASKTP
jgi:hypothetical protein